MNYSTLHALFSVINCSTTNSYWTWATNQNKLSRVMSSYHTMPTSLCFCHTSWASLVFPFVGVSIFGFCEYLSAGFLFQNEMGAPILRERTTENCKLPVTDSKIDKKRSRCFWIETARAIRYNDHLIVSYCARYWISCWNYGWMGRKTHPRLFLWQIIAGREKKASSLIAGAGWFWLPCWLYATAVLGNQVHFLLHKGICT